jgi:hypothetical protein
MEWIKCSDRLPSFDIPVLAWDASLDFLDPEYIFIGYYDPISCSDTGWRNDEYISLTPTHWMPLPSLPKD